MRALCERCKKTGGDAGHVAMRPCSSASYPGHAAFQCGECGERWLRHPGILSRFSWTRYDLQFGGEPRLAVMSVARDRSSTKGFW